MPEASATNDAPPLPGSDARQRFRRSLLRWYRRAHRALPWRAPPGERPNPYHVLVSEAMLQQTQVATVVDYFERFIAAFPTVEALAAADEQRVLTLWQGLGYYRRARHLHAAAKRIVDEHGGAVPRDAATLRTLPGVGDYTAGAIASIAFARAEPILDGNVARVLARWSGLAEPVDQPAARRRLWQLAAALVPRKHPGDFNQALMELGALVCTKRSPQCLICPLAAQCSAHQQGRTESLPAVSPRRAPRAVTHYVVAVRRPGDRSGRDGSSGGGDRRERYLFERRGPDGLWAGMWQLPTFEQPAEASPAALAERIADRFGLAVRVDPEPVASFTHQTTHRTIRFVISDAVVTAGRLKPRSGAWRRLDRLDDLPLANPQHRAVAALKG
jgi:A/G-specific adenine glycosylase